MIIGGKSFIGRALVDALRPADGWECVVSSRFPSAGTVGMDLLDEASVNRVVRSVRPSLVFNLAGPPRTASLRDAVALQVLGSSILLDAVDEVSRDAHVVLVGSAAEYGVRDTDTPAAEEDTLAPMSPYAVGKALQTRLAEAVRASGRQTVTVARVFNPIGPRQPLGFVCSDLIARCQLGRGPVRVERASSTRDFMDVRDVARALVILAEHAEEAVYNVGSGVGVSVGEVARAIGGLTGREVEFLDESQAAAHSTADSSRLRGLGWSPGFDICDTLREQVQAAIAP